MYQNKKWLVFTAVLFLSIFAAIPGANAQYNPEALKYFKSSLQNLTEGEYDKAIADCNRVLRIDPTSAVTYVVRARAYFEMGEMDRTIADCTQAIKHDKNNASAYVIRGNAHAEKSDLDKAIKDWEYALKINKDIPNARENIEIAKQHRGF